MILNGSSGFEVFQIVSADREKLNLNQEDQKGYGVSGGVSHRHEYLPNNY